MHCRMSQTHIVSMAKGGHECTKGCRVRAWISWSVREFGTDISIGHADRKQDAVWNLRNKITSGVTLFVCKGVFCDFATWSRLFVPWHHRALSLMPDFAHQDIKEGLLLFHSALQDQKAYYRDLSAFFAGFFWPLLHKKSRNGRPKVVTSPIWKVPMGAILKCWFCSCVCFLVITDNSWWHVLLYLNHIVCILL